MAPLGWKLLRPGAAHHLPPWLTDLEPLTTGLVAQEGLRLWHADGRYALGIRAGGMVYPVFPGPLDRALVASAKPILRRVPEQWCLMGPADWVETGLAAMPRSRILRRVRYQFMVRPRSPVVIPPGPGDLRIVREPDAEVLFPLQEAYEKEEVLFDPREFQPLVSRLRYAKTLKEQEQVALWDGDRPVAKAGTNALTEGWGQLGGVYTKPELRGRGLQKRLLGFLLARLEDQGRGACLFVKNENHRAEGLYRSLGFVTEADFTILYGERLPWAPVFR